MDTINFCIEFFPDIMTEKEIKSTAKQMNNCINTLKNSKKSITLTLSNYKQLKPLFSHGHENWPVLWRKETIFTEQNLIILSPDAEEDIEDLNPNYTYIIGGIVDRNRHKNYLKNFSTNQIVRKLNLKKFFKLTSKVLSINQCFGILVTFLNTNDWFKAYKSEIPKRRIIKEIFEGEKNIENEKFN